MSLYAHHHIRGLNTEHQIVVSHTLDQGGLVQSALHNALRRHTAVLLDQMLLQRAAVHAYPDGNAVLLRLIHNRLHSLLRTDISRINPDFIGAALNRRDSQAVVEMNISHQRDVNGLFNGFQAFSRLHSRNGHPDNIAACPLQLQNLGNGGCAVLSLCIAHRLNQNRIAAADNAAADLNWFR